MRFFPDSIEPTPSASAATPVTTSSAFGPTQTLYFASAPVGAPGAGDSDYFGFTLSNGTPFEVETRYQAGKGDAETYAGPRVEVHRPNGMLFASDDDSGDGRNAKLVGPQPTPAAPGWCASTRFTATARRAPTSCAPKPSAAARPARRLPASARS